MTQEKFPRNTRQRRIILEELQKTTSHPTAGGLYMVVRRRLPKISLGTVYRNLELLSRMGMVHKFEYSSGEARYDASMEQHDHLRCMSCGNVADVPGPPLRVAAGRRSDYGGYRVLGHRLEFLGLCPRCRHDKNIKQNKNIKQKSDKK